ncbi:MAG: hypothetical protein V3W31_06400, partial [Thermodesulfobacteriota bacterium]
MANRDISVKLAAAAFIVAAVTFLVYLPALYNGFVSWDDQLYVYENPNIRSLDAEFFGWLPTAVVSNNWHPLTVLSHAVDYALWGPDPMGHHLTSIVLHTLNVFLVFILAVRLVGDALPARALATGAVTALLFGLHPIHVESVVWVSERKDVLCAFFFLLSIIAYLRYVRSGRGEAGKGKATAYAASLAFFALALMSKPMAVTLPLVLLILDSYPLRRTEGARRAVFEKIPFFALSIFTSVITVWAQRTTEAVAALDAHPLATRLFIAVRAYAFYLYKTLFPLGLAPFYPVPENTSLLSIEFMAALALLVVVTVFCAAYLRRERAFSAVWLYYVATLLPVIGLVQVGLQSAADRYMYLPSLGPFLLVGLGAGVVVESYPKRDRQAAAFAALLIMAGLAVGTVRQTGVWK